MTMLGDSRFIRNLYRLYNENLIIAYATCVNVICYMILHCFINYVWFHNHISPIAFDEDMFWPFMIVEASQTYKGLVMQLPLHNWTVRSIINPEFMWRADFKLTCYKCWDLRTTRKFVRIWTDLWIVPNPNPGNQNLDMEEEHDDQAIGFNICR